MSPKERTIAARDRLIFALDVPDRAQAVQWMDRLDDTVSFYKIGLELLSGGDYFDVLRELARREKQIFVDLKLHDVPATVAGAVRGLARWPITFCAALGVHGSVDDTVIARARLAQEAGIDGVVCSGADLPNLRAAAPDLLTVCPGIRPSGPASDDQKRVVDVPTAFAQGADYIVVGRPIRQAADPRATAEQIVTQIEGAIIKAR